MLLNTPLIPPHTLEMTVPTPLKIVLIPFQAFRQSPVNTPVINWISQLNICLTPLMMPVNA